MTYLIRNKTLNSLQHNEDLPPLPKILLELQKLINDPDCNVDDVYRLIKADLVLTGKLITLSNNVFFGGCREKAGDIEEAIVRLGIKMALDLCYSVEVPQAFKKIKSFDQAQFWHHSLAVAYLSRMLTNKLIDDQDSLDAIFLAGLMRDIGILVFDYLIPEEYNTFLRTKDVCNSDQCMENIEKEIFGIDHQELGAMFLYNWWKLPPIIIEAVADHHKDYIDDDKSINLSHVISAANQLANQHGISHPIMTQHKEILGKDFLQKAGIPDSELALFIDQTKIGLLAFDCLFDS